MNKLNGGDGEALRSASLFRKMRALCRTMRKAQWRFITDSQIRHKEHCPLSYAGKELHAGFGVEGGRKLGFDNDSISAIMWAADSSNYGPASSRVMRRKLRRILLRAADLKERAP